MKTAIKAGIVVFPGTNCDRDAFMACEEFGWETEYIWHFETNLDGYDIIFLPGGFSYGDYIRSGRLAKFSPVMQAVKKFVENKQGFLIGICNGFQILCEAGLLPGVLTDNWNTRFICNVQELKLRNHPSPQPSPARGEGEIRINLPIAHGEGRYLADAETIEQLKEKDMIFLTYANNPNGSIEDIAGLYDKERRIIGMMPHPERAFFDELGNTDGKEIFKLVEQSISR
jgi:phosphoribosylformylglycinamidine synthase subunit PurQ / glutaminase